MKKLFSLALLVGAAITASAQTSRTAPEGWHCVKTNFGGCYSYIIGSTCTEYIYHVEICCGPGSWGTGYQVCHATSWTTLNPNYRLNSGDTPVPGRTTTLEELVKSYAAGQGVKPETITSFRVTNCEPFQGADGSWYVVEPNAYKIDKSVAGWELTGINFVPYKKE